MLYFLIHKLASLSAILDLLAPRIEDRTSATKAKGVLLGMLEDFIVTVLLAVSLVLVELASLFLSRAMVWSGADEHFHTSMILRAVGQFTRFTAVFVLVAVALAPFSMDMALLRALKTSDESSVQDQQGVKLQRDRLHSSEATRHGSDFDAMVGVIVVSFVFAVLFVWLVDLLHWWPKSKEIPQATPISRTLSFSTPTYMDIRFEPYRVLQMDLEAAMVKGDSRGEATSACSRHTTIVSAPSELYGEDDSNRLSHARVEVSTCRAMWLDPWLKISLVACAGVGFFMLFVDLTRAASQLTSPLVAGIALNASLNELVHNLFQIQFLPVME